MVNIGIIGYPHTGRFSFLQMFIDRIRTPEFSIRINDGFVQSIIIQKIDLFEDNLDNARPLGVNRVIFKREDKDQHNTLIMMGGERRIALTRVGIVTISRISKKLIVLFSFAMDLTQQFQIFNDLRFFPHTITVVLNHYDYLLRLPKEVRDRLASDFFIQIQEFFAQRKITIQRICVVISINMLELNEYNNAVRDIVLNLAEEHPDQALLDYPNAETRDNDALRII